ncbi:hypothetical protein B0T09DRAFT_358110 [Sordaria sp. MPI-SDFR-AT-0083]|nr:hypothetical protein B0T09DRAFT_358110 [Sordaria sp. MPI-SDFR-AT-0083]
MDIFFQASTTEAGILNNHKNILVVGEQKKSYEKRRFKTDFLQLTRYVRKVFADQPTRRFVHAFLLCASEMELWIFDRAGAYSSGSFDIHKKADMFARALVSYATMDAEAMGRDTFIERVIKGGRKNRYITLTDTGGQAMRIRLNRAMYSQKAIVNRGTTCYTTENNSVVKFAWASGKRTAEVDYLTTQPSSSTSKTKPTLSTPSEDLWEDRIYSCLVISPAGRIITDGFKGMLIDLDMAKVSDSGPSGARQITDTVQFMAIEVLHNIDHTYRHNLESFFYVLLWMFSQIAMNKKGDVSVNFEIVLEEFSEKLKVLEPLCIKIRKILFPYDKDASVNIGTPAGESDQLYKPIIVAYDQAICEL